VNRKAVRRPGPMQETGGATQGAHMPPSRSAFAALAFSLVASALPAVGGFVLTDLAPGRDIPLTCNAMSLMGPEGGGSLFALRSDEVWDSDPAEDDILWHLYNGTSIGRGPTSCDWKGPSGFGNWQCFNNEFTPQPVEGQTIWGVITAYLGGSPGGIHEGWILLDSSPAADGDATRPQSPQRLRLPKDGPGGIDFPTGRVEGTLVTFEYPTEFSGGPEVDSCHLGGNTDQPGFDGRIIAGFNLYRLDTTVVDRPDSTPHHYLCGPDLDCATAADNGFVAFIPLDPAVAGCGIDDAPCMSDDPVQWPYEIADLPGTPNVDILFVDQPPDPGGNYSRVLQPVLRVNDMAKLSDWYGMASLDLDGDTQPEFVDPGNNGLGLTNNGLTPGTDPVILITLDTPFPRDARLDNDRNVGPPDALGDIRIDWWPSPDEGGPHPITYTILRGRLEDLRGPGYTYGMVDSNAWGITDHHYYMERQVDGEDYYYVVVPVSGDQATFGYDSNGVERPEVPVTP
jgi:hypothetical protein